MRPDPSWLASVVFLAVYAAIISEKVNRTVAAGLGAGAVVLLGLLSQERALEHVDFNTIGLLVGMMIIVNVLRRTGVFPFLAYWLARRARGRAWPIMAGFTLFTAFASAFIDNVTTVLLMIPVTFAVCETLELDPRPFVISQVLASNVGGTATLIGDPPNILIGSATGIDFNTFALHLAPVVLIVLAVHMAGFWLLWGRRLHAEPARVAELAGVDPARYLQDRRLLARTGAVLALVILGFILHGVLHLDVATIALVGAALLLLTLRHEQVHEMLAEVEWSTIFFFAGLFVVVGALEDVGMINLAARGLVAVTAGDPVALTLGLLWFSAITSAVVDNIPAVTTLIPVVQDVARLTNPGVAADAALWQRASVLPLWWALALGADLGGNATVIGASANVVASGIAARRGVPIGFVAYLKVGAPFTLVSILVCTLYLLLRYL
jgi:Na+/H+ antiporter NhaD/arsenite permease-like protein